MWSTLSLPGVVVARLLAAVQEVYLRGFRGLLLVLLLL
jgi:hypothetical protein